MMRVYFYGPPTSQRVPMAAYERIKEVCGQASIELSTNTETHGTNLPSETIAELHATGLPLLDAMHAIIVEGSTADPQAGYLLAYALAEKRPLLYLYTRGEVAPEILRYLRLQEVPRHITVKTYIMDNVERIVSDFLARIGDVRVREIPRIKYTLRLTRTIDEYLDFKTRNTKTSKADYLRERIEKELNEDEAFQQHLKKRRQE